MTKQPEAPRESILAHNNMGLSIEREREKERVKVKVLSKKVLRNIK